tara:strand:+ start:127 stop:552 length:426 start_codon:yes stop_codon:yes gene_type:complete
MADEGAYRNPALAVDAVSVRDGPRGAQVLLITRGFPPYKGRLAFPGGFVEVGEDPETAVLRELIEETGIEGNDPELFAVRGNPSRDPRKHIVSIFYRVRVDAGAIPVAGDDAVHAEWIDLDGLMAEQLAGDHFSIIEELRK